MKLIKAAILIAMYVTALSTRAEAPFISQTTYDAGSLLGLTTVDVTTYHQPFFKEDLKNVEADAYDFMAGEPMTLALKEQIKKVREVEISLAEASDEEVVLEIINVIKQ